MQEAVKIVLNVLEQMNFESYYAGTQCRNECCNSLIKTKINSTDMMQIITVAPITKLKTIFKNHKEVENDTIKISFANHDYLIIHINSLKDYFNSQNFTINCVVQDKNENYIYANSAQQDIQNQLIIAIINSKENFTENPLQLLEAYILGATVGFDIDKTTVKHMKSAIKYIKNIDATLIGKYFKRIITEKYALKMLLLMQKQGFFKYYLKSWGKIDLTVLSKLRMSSNTILETFAIIYDDENIMEEEVTPLDILSAEDILSIKWLINHKTLCNQTDNVKYRKAIYEASKTLYKQDIHLLQYLILKSNRIYKTISGDTSALQKSKNILFNVYSRPYFLYQLDVDISESRKKKLLESLLLEQCYPMDEEQMDEYIVAHNI